MNLGAAGPSLAGLKSTSIVKRLHPSTGIFGMISPSFTPLNERAAPELSLTITGLPRTTGRKSPTLFGFCNFHVMVCIGSVTFLAAKSVRAVIAKTVIGTELLRCIFICETIFLAGVIFQFVLIETHEPFYQL